MPRTGMLGEFVCGAGWKELEVRDIFAALPICQAAGCTVASIFGTTKVGELLSCDGRCFVLLI